MSTTEDFENAPIGATATDADGNRAMKTDLGEWCWVFQNGDCLDDEEMERRGYTLDPLVPTTASEALELAWELAHPVKEGQTIPKGTRYLIASGYGVKEYTAQRDFKTTPEHVSVTRTLEPLPEPEPDWLDAPAVMARVDDHNAQQMAVFTPTGTPNRWAKSDTEWAFHWNELRDVVPLYPEGKKE